MPDAKNSPDDAGSPRLAELLAWRQNLVDSGAVSKSTFKETHLRMILRSGRTAVEDIRAMLPGSVAEYADELAAVLAGTHSVPPAATAVEQPDDDVGRHRVTESAAPDDDFEKTTMVRAVGSRPPARPSHEAAPSAEDFAAFTFGRSPGAPVGDPEAITVGAFDADAPGRPLSWPAYVHAGGGEAVVIYRLVAADDSAPYAPERARLVTATTSTAAVDARPPGSAVRYYQVWANVGPGRTEALAAQPIKHAEGVAVSPVTGCEVREDSGRVTGSWSAPAGVSSVFVFRIPADAARESPAHRILADQDNVAGFVDVDAEPGRSYLYRVRAAASVDGVLRLSEPRDTAVDISAVLQPVTDLSAQAHPSATDVFELGWTAPPSGDVVIYRSQGGPSVGADADELPEAALEQVGLTPDLRLNQPIARQRAADGEYRSVMSGVSWPQTWSRAYFTPVTIMSGRAVLGRTFSTVRTGVIRDVDIAEYCNKQVLTFDWPEGAAEVSVFVAPKGYDPRKGLTGTSFEISAEEYDKYGGLQLPNGKLPIAGCSLHLAPVAFTGGRRVTGSVRSIEYTGLLRLQYVVQVERQPDGSASYARIYLRSQVDTPGSPAFVLINNPERIPLSPTDGQAVDAAPMDSAGQITAKPSKELRWSALTTTGTQEAWAADLRGRRGWIRLFVNSPSAQRLSTIALLDPAVSSLRLGGGAP